MSSFQLFKPTYTDKATGEKRQSPTFNIRFRDHLKRRQTSPPTTTSRRPGGSPSA